MSVLPKQPKRQAIQTLAFYSDDMSWSPRNACMLMCDVTLLDHSRSSSGDTFFLFQACVEPEVVVHTSFEN